MSENVGKKVFLKDKNGNYIFPITHSKLIEVSDSETLYQRLESIENRLKAIEQTLAKGIINKNTYIGIDNKKNISYILGVPISTGLNTDEITVPMETIDNDEISINSIIANIIDK